MQKIEITQKDLEEMVLESNLLIKKWREEHDKKVRDKLDSDDIKCIVAVIKDKGYSIIKQ